MPKTISQFDFITKQLERDPDISFADIKAKADAKGIKVAPISYGRAKSLLGLLDKEPKKKRVNHAADRRDHLAPDKEMILTVLESELPLETKKWLLDKIV